MNKKVTIFTVSYDKDLEFLKYNLKSIKEFCRSFYKNIIIIDNIMRDCGKTREYLEKIGQPYFVDNEARQIKNGYVRQQYIKFMADKYMPENCEYIAWVDSDSIFLQKQTPEVYFKKNKPIMVKYKYKDIQERLKQLPQERRIGDQKAYKVWQDTTSELVGFDVDYEYMQCMPFIYPVETQKRFREYLENLHGKSLLEIMKDIPMMADANVIGAYCEKFEKDKFSWIDRGKDEDFNEFIESRRKFYGHYSSRKEAQAVRYVDLSKKDNIISKIFNEKK